MQQQQQQQDQNQQTQTQQQQGQEADQTKKPDQLSDYSKHFAALARKEKKLVERENQWKQEREMFKPKVEEYEKLNNIFSQAKTKDPKAIKAALDVLGLTAGEISQISLQDPELQEDPQIYNIKKQMEDYKKELEELKSYREKKENEEKQRAESKEFEQSMTMLKSEVGKVLESNKDKFDLCQCLGDDLYEKVLEIGDDYFTKNDGEILPLDKILEMIENQEEQRLSKFKSSRKFGQSAVGNDNQDNKGTIPPTLNNNVGKGDNIDLTGLTGNARMNAIIKKFSQK